MTLTVTIIAKSYNISFMNQTKPVHKRTTVKYILFMTLLSLEGLPSFIGFPPKWTVIQLLIINYLIFAIFTVNNKGTL